jgi:hypothetical protein
MEHTQVPREVYGQMLAMIPKGDKAYLLISYIYNNWGTQYAEFQFQLHHCKALAMNIQQGAGSLAKSIAPICTN